MDFTAELNAQAYPLIHMAMLQVMMSLEFLDKVGDNDPNAMALLQDLLRQFQERSSQVVKNQHHDLIK